MIISGVGPVGLRDGAFDFKFKISNQNILSYFILCWQESNLFSIKQKTVRRFL